MSDLKDGGTPLHVLSYLQALRLHQEYVVARTLDLICRIPALRHSPLKELSRLAAHLKESTYTQGEVPSLLGCTGRPMHVVIAEA
jgi:hypothetical protein